MLVDNEGCFRLFISESHGTFAELEVFRLGGTLVGEDEFQRVLFASFVIEVEGGKGCACFREGVEVRSEGDARYHLG